MVTVRTVYYNCTETRSTYDSLRGDGIALIRAIRDCDVFQLHAKEPLAYVAQSIAVYLGCADLRYEVQS